MRNTSGELVEKICNHGFDKSETKKVFGTRANDNKNRKGVTSCFRFISTPALNNL